MSIFDRLKESIKSKKPKPIGNVYCLFASQRSFADFKALIKEEIIIPKG